MGFTDSVRRLLEASEALTSRRQHDGGRVYGRRLAHGVLCPALRSRGLRHAG